MAESVGGNLLAKVFCIVLIVLGFASLINGATLLSSNLLLAAVNIFAALILLYAGFSTLKSRKENKREEQKDS